MKKYYDAVIVGCGVAGCFAALHLPQEADILMITKADTEDCVTDFCILDKYFL